MSTLVEKLSAALGSLESAEELAREIGEHVASLPLSSGSAAASSELPTLLSTLLYPAITEQQPTLEVTASFLDKVFQCLPETSGASQENEEGEPKSSELNDQPKAQVADQPPKNHKEVLQFAICDTLWALDSSFEASAAPAAEPWPAPRDAKVPLQDLSPRRYALRSLLALLRVRPPQIPPQLFY